MAESPPRGERGAPRIDPGAGSSDEKKGASDPLFNPPGLSLRKTAMGLAPAPHLGGADRANAAADAEARKQRVLARIAAMDAERPRTGRPPPAAVEPLPPPYTGPPPPIEPAFGTTTAIMHGVGSMPGSRAISSDGRMPTDSGWDVHEDMAETEMTSPPQPWAYRSRPPVPEAMTEVIEPAPTTARMIQTSTLPSLAPAVPPAPLAVRPWEPSHSKPPPPLTGPFDRRLVLLDDPHSPRAASFRLLRDTLIGKSMPRVIAVSSPAPNDGKTTCSANLALAFAELNSTRVLLIDGNFFEPQLAEIFSIDRLTTITPPGGSGWLLPYKLVDVTGSLHLAAMAKAAAPRFDQQRFDAMIERLVRISYDYIIVDTPAMRGTPAVIQMIAAVDATLLAVRSGGTTARDLRRAAEQIPQNKALGIALIDAIPQH